MIYNMPKFCFNIANAVFTSSSSFINKERSKSTEVSLLNASSISSSVSYLNLRQTLEIVLAFFLSWPNGLEYGKKSLWPKFITMFLQKSLAGITMLSCPQAEDGWPLSSGGALIVLPGT